MSRSESKTFSSALFLRQLHKVLFRIADEHFFIHNSLFKIPYSQSIFMNALFNNFRVFSGSIFSQQFFRCSYNKAYGPLFHFLQHFFFFHFNQSMAGFNNFNSFTLRVFYYSRFDFFPSFRAFSSICWLSILAPLSILCFTLTASFSETSLFPRFQRLL